MLSHRIALRILVASLALFVATTAMGQSGRRVPKQSPAPVPTPTPETPTAPAKPVAKKPAVELIVGIERPDFMSSPRAVTTGNILRSFTDRLDDHPSVKVNAIRGDYSRSDAIKRAKSEKEAYVVLLELRAEPRSDPEAGQYRVVYWVFSPETAKLKTSGQTYPHTYRNRGVILNPRAPSIYGDYRLEQAAREAAERVLDAFNLHIPEKRNSLQSGVMSPQSD